ncbi:hypothetical protein HCU40_11240 [Pseudanabaena biceps]|nr:hypothetical protein [Pseudanabaena biceps]
MQNIDNKNQIYITQDVDAYNDNVDNLMDDLFGEVENTLHVSYAKQRSLRQKNSQTLASKNLASYSSVNSSSSDIVAISKGDPADQELTNSKDTVSITKMNMSDISLPPISKQDVLWIQPYIMQNPEPTSHIPTGTNDPEIAKSNLLDRLLIVGACSSALIAAIMWTVNHGIWLSRQSLITPQPIAKNVLDNNKYSEEIKRMLSEANTTNRTIANSPNAVNSIGSGIPLITAPMIGGNMPLPLSVNPLVSMQQPMYVPVYQPPTLNGNLPSPLALPPATSNGAIAISNSGSANSPLPIASRNESESKAISQPTPSYTLVGILDLGDRSTAMFDMNGSVQSIRLGKSISDSGWVLSRVSQQEVTLKRGKDTKNILVGQKF